MNATQLAFIMTKYNGHLVSLMYSLRGAINPMQFVISPALSRLVL